ncbi:G2/mitotic-specific cyclin-B3-like [Drosophila serrata]|uniref:G2/mitotic-specific cyclin-B3-like n=1 Tax=Drosophila serrata TaxID=7274 RepID=UPI000A1D0030|nr:G2/mitotic-specific cyclin-B3-like [Drosophila serrata]
MTFPILQKHIANELEENDAHNDLIEYIEEEAMDVVPHEKPLSPLPILHSPFIDVESIDQDQKQPDPRKAALLAIDNELNNEDPMQTWPYAMDVFIYQKEREKDFIIGDYMVFRPHLNPWKRRLLIRWMVNVHQAFGTYRESHFLSVKIVDLSLCRYAIDEDMLELLGAAAIKMASKFEALQTVPANKLLKFCKRTYTATDLMEMEWSTMRRIGCDLGIPIGYRFLRRYARTAVVPESTWTLASYILELAIFEYVTIGYSDSQMAAAALFIALRMSNNPGQLDGNTWNAMLVYNSGYKLPDFARLVPVLNAVVHSQNCETVEAVRSLYSTPLLYEVAKVRSLSNEELFRDNPDLYNTIPS